MKFTIKARDAVVGLLVFSLLNIPKNSFANPQTDQLTAVTKSAQNGDLHSQSALALLYYSGGGQITPDYKQAEFWARKAAVQGDPASQTVLGRLYLTEKGNYKEAAVWYYRAAMQGYALAQGNLALAYGAIETAGESAPNFHGYKDAKNLGEEEYFWSYLAASAGIPAAIELRDNTARRIGPEKVAEIQKFAREWQPVKTTPIVQDFPDTSLPPDQLATEVKRDRSDFFKKFGITVASRDNYPVTIFEPDHVPVPRESFFNGRGPFHWIDDDKIIYLKKTPPQFGDDGKRLPEKTPIIEVDLKSLKTTEVAPAATALCYDYETRNIYYVDIQVSSEENIVAKYGKLGKEPLQEIRRAKTEKHSFYLNPQDCTLYHPFPNISGGFLREGDGYFKFQFPIPSIVFTRPDGSKKEYSFGGKINPGIRYDYFSKHYWIRTISKDDKVIIHQFDRKLDALSDDEYPLGFDAVYASSKPGLLFIESVAAHDEAGKLVRTSDGGVVDSVQGLFLMTKGNVHQLIDGEVKNEEVSPDGCRVVFLRDGKVGLIELCQNIH